MVSHLYPEERTLCQHIGKPLLKIALGACPIKHFTIVMISASIQAVMPVIVNYLNPERKHKGLELLNF
jgi:hypothetical protein